MGDLRRGDVFFADLPGSDGHVIGYKKRPWVVVQNDMGNRNSSVTIVIPMTTRDVKPLPTHVTLLWGGIHGTVLAEQIRVIDQDESFEVVEHLPPQIMRHVDEAIAVSLGLKG